MDFQIYGEGKGLRTDNVFVHPRSGGMGRMLSAIANSHVLASIRRASIGKLPFITLESQVSDIVYLNWVVPTIRLQAFVPDSVELISVNGQSIFTVLTYSHGHFGPSVVGPLRKLFPSPLQSNWRAYVKRIAGKESHVSVVLFVKNIFSGAFYAVGTRVLSDALPSHLAHAFVHRKTPRGYETIIEQGEGSAPGFQCATSMAATKWLPADYAPFFSDWSDAVATICLQESAIVPAVSIGRIAQAGIDLPIPLADVMPLDAMSYEPGELLKSLGADTKPFCFCVPATNFKVLWEKLI